MPLTDFAVIHGRTLSDDPEISCRDGRKPVLVQVTQNAWDDTFPLAPDEAIKSLQEHNLLSETNLDALKDVIQARYDAEEYYMLKRFGSTLPLIVLELRDLTPIKPKLSRSAQDLSRKAKFS